MSDGSASSSPCAATNHTLNPLSFPSHIPTLCIHTNGRKFFTPPRSFPSQHSTLCQPACTGKSLHRTPALFLDIICPRQGTKAVQTPTSSPLHAATTAPVHACIFQERFLRQAWSQNWQIFCLPEEVMMIHGSIQELQYLCAEREILPLRSCHANPGSDR